MANNRIYIVCNKCQGFETIAKFYPVQWAAYGDLTERLNSFFEKHDKCWLENDYEGVDAPWGNNMYRFVHESDKDIVICIDDMKIISKNYEN